MTDPAAVLAGCLPKDPADTEGTGVPAGALRNVLSELLTCRELLRRRERPDGGE